jgi:hypothetical protein
MNFTVTDWPALRRDDGAVFLWLYATLVLLTVHIASRVRHASPSRAGRQRRTSPPSAR